MDVLLLAAVLLALPWSERAPCWWSEVRILRLLMSTSAVRCCAPAAVCCVCSSDRRAALAGFVATVMVPSSTAAWLRFSA